MTFMKPIRRAKLLGLLFYFMFVKLEFINLRDGVSVASTLNLRILCFFRYITISHLVN